MRRGSGSEHDCQGVALRSGCLTGCGVQAERHPGWFLPLARVPGADSAGNMELDHSISSVRPHASSSLTVRRTGLRSVAPQLDVACSEQACPLPLSRTCAPTKATCMFGRLLLQGHTRSVPQVVPDATQVLPSSRGGRDGGRGKSRACPRSRGWDLRAGGLAPNWTLACLSLKVKVGLRTGLGPPASCPLSSVVAADAASLCSPPVPQTPERGGAPLLSARPGQGQPVVHRSGDRKQVDTQPQRCLEGAARALSCQHLSCREPAHEIPPMTRS